ncbi:MAG: hypothetical protein H4O13_07425 [Xanthomonadales bacterium]|nr:hypothetical protein [Xanthomonadales bacterium]
MRKRDFARVADFAALAHSRPERFRACRLRPSISKKSSEISLLGADAEGAREAVSSAATALGHPVGSGRLSDEV